MGVPPLSLKAISHIKSIIIHHLNNACKLLDIVKIIFYMSDPQLHALFATAHFKLDQKTNY